MRLGIDFGTTRVIVAACDRGNYPLVSFETQEGAFDWFPPLVAVSGEQTRFGWDAWAVQGDPEWTVVRSIKRCLESSGPETRVEIGGHVFPLMTLLAGLTRELHSHLATRSSLGATPDEPLEAVVGVPASSNSNQRFLTVEAFRAAGFRVLGLLNEPSAASLEYGHRNRSITRHRNRILVYDLGGGTFDVSLVELDQQLHSVIATEGISTLGGDDFDHHLADLALEASELKIDTSELNPTQTFALLEECRAQKESINPNTRKVTIDLAMVDPEWDAVSIPVPALYERCTPLIEETVHAVEDLLSHEGVTDTNSLEALYLTGGASELPLVSRVLRETFGRRVKRSAYMRAATAIGLAIHADQQSGYVLREMFTRYFGVWREADAGRRMLFDPLFSRGTRLPSAGEPPLESVRQYRPVHNIGHFRYLESTHVTDDGQPAGDVTVWDEIRFPFDPAQAHTRTADLADIDVVHSEAAASQLIEERYSCDSAGVVSVEISNLTTGYSREYRLGRWSTKEEIVAPAKRRKPRGKAARSQN
jgi:molecular chaperone DnaK (HSP70)